MTTGQLGIEARGEELAQQEAAPAKARGARRLLPGFGLSMGITIVYLCLIVLIPISTIVLKSSQVGWAKLWEIALGSRALASYSLSFGASLVAALVNAFFGVVVAWVLVRYRFPGKGVVDALIDLPFALPTAVGGIALTGIYSSRGWIGQHLAKVGIQGAYSRLGVVIALIFVGLPFVVRTVQPVLEELDADQEEAAATLGATRWQTFTKVTLPAISPAILTGFAMAFARSLGEYGSVVFIAGNMPFKTEIAPLLIMTRLEQYDYAGATAIAIVMLAASFVLLLLVNRLQAWSGAKGVR